jgi:hypothetical protein
MTKISTPGELVKGTFLSVTLATKVTTWRQRCFRHTIPRLGLNLFLPDTFTFIIYLPLRGLSPRAN